MRQAFISSLCAVFLLTLVAGSTDVFGHHVDDTNERLAKVGPAPEFELTAQDGTRFSINNVKGKVVAVSFTYTSCIDTCPLLTAKMVAVQNKLGNKFGSNVFFVTVSMDPEVDRPEVLETLRESIGLRSRRAGRLSLGQKLKYKRLRRTTASFGKNLPTVMSSIRC